MSEKVNAWKRKDLSKQYLSEVRSAIPLAEFQIEIILDLIQKAKPDLKSFLDLGCGDGILGRAILSNYPAIQGIFVDFSDTMIRDARMKAPDSNRNLAFIVEDYGKPSWIKSVAKYGEMDVVVSGL